MFEEWETENQIWSNLGSCLYFWWEKYINVVYTISSSCVSKILGR